jgi:integration host factor subunit beta
LWETNGNSSTFQGPHKSGKVDINLKKPYIFRMVVVLQDIVREVSKATKLALPDARVVVQKILDTLRKGLASGQRIEIRDFGVFRVKTVTGKKGRDMARNLAINLPAYKKVSFRPGKKLKKFFWNLPVEPVKKQAPSGWKGQLEMFVETSKL